MPSELPLNAGTLPAPYTCWQTLYNLMFSLGSADAPTVTGILIQDAVPAPEDHDKGWIPTAGGIPRFPGYVFTWNSVIGHWVSRHPKPANDPRPEIYTGDPAALPTFDGGGTGTGESGPMWEVFPDFAGRVPVGLGTIPGSAAVINYAYPPPTQDSLGNSGEYQHVLTGAEGAVADHIHPFGLSNPGTDDAFFTWTGAAPTSVPSWQRWFVTGGGSQSPGTETTADLFTQKANNGNGVVSTGHNNMMPWLGVTFIRRTSRQFYIAA